MRNKTLQHIQDLNYAVTRTSGTVSLEGGHAPSPPPPCVTKPQFCDAGERGACPSPPATQNNVFVSQTKLWTPTCNLLDDDTCVTPETQNWTDLNCTIGVWDGSGPKIEGS